MLVDEGSSEHRIEDVSEFASVGNSYPGRIASETYLRMNSLLKSAAFRISLVSVMLGGVLIVGRLAWLGLLGMVPGLMSLDALNRLIRDEIENDERRDGGEGRRISSSSVS